MYCECLKLRFYPPTYDSVHSLCKIGFDDATADKFDVIKFGTSGRAGSPIGATGGIPNYGFTGGEKGGGFGACGGEEGEGVVDLGLGGGEGKASLAERQSSVASVTYSPTEKSACMTWDTHM